MQTESLTISLAFLNPSLRRWKGRTGVCAFSSPKVFNGSDSSGPFNEESCEASIFFQRRRLSTPTSCNLFSLKNTILMEPNGNHMQNNIHQEFLIRYQPIHEGFTRYCSSRAFGLMEAEDLVQEAVLVALQGFAKIKDKEKLLSFLIGTVNNILRNRKRKEKRESQWDEQLAGKIQSRDISPELAFDIQLLMRSIKRLPAKQEEALLLFEISGFSIREVAEIQECSVGAVKTRLSRSRKALKEKFVGRAKEEKLSAAMVSLVALLIIG